MTVRSTVKKFTPDAVIWLYRFIRYYRLKFLTFVPTYYEDEILTGHGCHFMGDHHFMRCYNAAVSAGLAVSDKIHWRVHVACWAAARGATLEGDFVECGVYKGFLSRIAMDYVGFGKLPKTFYLMDTYEGLSDKCISAGERENGMKAGGYDPSYEFVVNTFKDYKNVKVIKGTIPDTLSEVTSDKVAYLSIDMNCVIPEIAAAEYFWDKLVPGAVIVLDDYGFDRHIAQKLAFDEFAKKQNISILSLPTGQGLIVKPG